jgi:hypothetical protein
MLILLRVKGKMQKPLLRGVHWEWPRGSYLVTIEKPLKYPKDAAKIGIYP